MKAVSSKYVAGRLPDTGRGTWRDPEFRGLECVGRATKARWYLRQSIDGQRFRHNLASFPETTPAKARELARAKLDAVNTKIAATDKTAVAQDLRREQRARKDRAEAPDFGDAIDEYCRIELADTKRQEKTRREIRSFFKKFLTKRPDQLPPDALARHVESEKARKPSHANTVLRRSKPLFRWMHKRGWTPAPLLEDAKVEQSPERDVSPSVPFVAQILLAADAETNQTTRYFVWMAVLTAARLGNIQQMMAGEIDVQDHVWKIPKEKAKTKVDYQTPLSDSAMSVVVAMDDVNGESVVAAERDAYVFRGRARRIGKPAGFFNGVSKLKARLDYRLKSELRDKFEEWTFHDLRRSFSDAAIDAGHDPAIVDRCLNHSAAATTSRIQRRYQQGQQVERQRAVFETWASLLDAELAKARGEVPELNIVTMHGRA